jgi:hypothetical protein
MPYSTALLLKTQYSSQECPCDTARQKQHVFETRHSCSPSQWDIKRTINTSRKHERVWRRFLSSCLTHLAYPVWLSFRGNILCKLPYGFNVKVLKSTYTDPSYVSVHWYGPKTSIFQDLSILRGFRLPESWCWFCSSYILRCVTVTYPDVSTKCVAFIFKVW